MTDTIFALWKYLKTINLSEMSFDRFWWNIRKLFTDILESQKVTYDTLEVILELIVPDGGAKSLFMAFLEIFQSLTTW